MKKRILIIDKDIDSQNLFMDMCRAKGYDARSIECWDDLIAVALQFKPHIILIDIANCQSMNKSHIIHQLKCEPELQGIVVVASAYATPQNTALQIVDSDYYVMKPILPMLLGRMIKQILSHNGGVGVWH